MIENINRKLFSLPSGASVLDIGSASGQNSMDLKKLGYKVTAIEIDPELVKAFKSNPDSAGIDIHLGDATKMPFPDNSFDGAIILEVIEHIKDTEALLHEIGRVLKPGGRLCVGVPTGYTERFSWKVFPDYPKNTTHVKIFQKKQLTDILNSFGFKVRAVETKNFVPAITWFFHSIARSKSDHTGKIHNHLIIDRIVYGSFTKFSKVPVLNKTITAAGRRFDKSWYFYCEKI
jgi:ubiquinone/menaquinone biosynthesis C-methylase UbiE